MKPGDLRRVAAELRSSAQFPNRRIWSDDLLKLADNLDALLDRIEELESALRTAMAGMEHSRNGVCSMTGAEHAALAKARTALESP